MSSASTLAKLAELRAKTDRDLVAVIDSELNRGLHFALGADETSPMDGRGAAELAHRMAEAVYADAAKLLAVVDDLGERRRLERKLKQLRHALDRGSARREMCVQAAIRHGDFGRGHPPNLQDDRSGSLALMRNHWWHRTPVPFVGRPRSFCYKSV